VILTEVKLSTQKGIFPNATFIPQMESPVTQPDPPSLEVREELLVSWHGVTLITSNVRDYVRR